MIEPTRVFLCAFLLLNSSAGASSETPERFFCQLKALSTSQRAAHEALTKRLLGAVLERRELPDGLEFRVDARAVSIVDLAAWAQAEHLCCPFLRLGIDQQPNAGPLSLRLTGPDGVKAFLLEELASVAP